MYAYLILSVRGETPATSRGRGLQGVQATDTVQVNVKPVPSGRLMMYFNRLDGSGGAAFQLRVALIHASTAHVPSRVCIDRAPMKDFLRRTGSLSVHLNTSNSVPNPFNPMVPCRPVKKWRMRALGRHRSLSYTVRRPIRRSSQ